MLPLDVESNFGSSNSINYSGLLQLNYLVKPNPLFSHRNLIISAMQEQNSGFLESMI